MNDHHSPSNDTSTHPPLTETIAGVLETTLALNTENQRLILNCALAAGIVGVLPSIAWLYELKLILVFLISLFMVRNVARRWRFIKGHRVQSLVMALLGFLGALAVPVMAFITFYSISLFAPIFRSFAEVAAYFAFTLAFGRVANDFSQGGKQIHRDRLAPFLVSPPPESSEIDPDATPLHDPHTPTPRAAWNRRRALLAAFGGGVAVESTLDYQRWKNSLTASPDGSPQYENPFEAAYSAKVNWVQEVEAIREVARQARITPPQKPYDHEIARRLIFACKIAVLQYRVGLDIPTYDGNIRSLKSLPATFARSELVASFSADVDQFHQLFGPSRQVATLVAEQDFFENYLDVLNAPPSAPGKSPLQRLLRPVEATLFEAVPKLVRRHYKQPVFAGFVLDAKHANLISFRGTQNSGEWLYNLRSHQTPFHAPDAPPSTSKPFGWIHGGFLALAEKLTPSLNKIAAQLDPSKPCYITGHSLGAALATIVAMKLALANPALRPQIRLYTFAGPRVGDPTFAQNFSALLPDTYRVVNLADSVPLVPTSTMDRNFLHVGQEVSFVGKFGDLLLNHLVDAYQHAIEEGIEQTGPLSELPILTSLR